MQIKIVVDNNTFVDQFFMGEPATSFYIEVDGLKILLDTGFSDILLSNASKMGIDLSQLTHIVLSHGHNDHSNGLKYLDNTIPLSNLKIISHPRCFNPKTAGNQYIGAPFSEEEIRNKSNYIPSETPLFLSENCVFLGEIPQKNDFEARSPFGLENVNGEWQDDYLLDDSAVALKTPEGLFIITSCSHSGVCNVVEYAKEVCNENRIAGILGGFHLFDVNERLTRTIDYLESCPVGKLYPCHCVSLLAKAKMMERLPIQETGVGLTIEL
jgi:7,8-dihydropterin-6-yl-methyl-4-(beta-D-ribofuranosyl)aminobenzene 5'-phosphate synthase